MEGCLCDLSSCKYVHAVCRSSRGDVLNQLFEVFREFFSLKNLEPLSYFRFFSNYQFFDWAQVMSSHHKKLFPVANSNILIARMRRQMFWYYWLKFTQEMFCDMNPYRPFFQNFDKICFGSNMSRTVCVFKLLATKSTCSQKFIEIGELVSSEKNWD